MNILVIRTHRLGDILQLTPMLRGVRETYPKGKIYFLTGEEYTPLIEGNPDVDAIIPVPEKRYRYLLRNRPDSYPGIFNEFYDLIDGLKRERFDLIINRQYEWGALLSHLVGAERIVGGSYSPEGGFCFEDRPSRELFETIRGDRRENRRNLVDWGCRIAQAPPGGNRRMYLPVGPGARREAARLTGGTGAGATRPLVGVQMGAAKAFRRWGADHCAQVIGWLINEKHRGVVLLGSEEEGDLSARVVQKLSGEEGHLINLTGKTSLGTAAAVLERCEILITGDTGPMHMAAAVGTPVLSIFSGPAYPWETGPYGPGHFVLYSDVPCSPCSDPECCERNRECKEMMRPSLIMKAFEAFETFREGKAIAWECDAAAVRLFVTARDAEGEQVLLPPEDLNGSAPGHDRFTGDTDEEGRLPEILHAKGDEIIRTFLEGDGERGFLSFPDYLDQWLALAGALAEGGDGVLETVRRLLQGCLEALDSRDTVTLMDAIEYGFKPLLESSLCFRHGLGGRCEDVIR